LSVETRDHGGGVDAAAARFGGTRAQWLDLSTGINPLPFAPGDVPMPSWADLPDRAAQDALVQAAREFWSVPDAAAVLAVPGASAAIAQIPWLTRPESVDIPGPTYNEHAAAFADAGWRIADGQDGGTAPTASVHVHPNNPDGRLWRAHDIHGALRVIDESFCDVMPERSLMSQATAPGTLILKSFGKFWGLAGLRLGFVIGDPLYVDTLARRLGPWPVSGPALHIGAAALRDTGWANATRDRLERDADRLDTIMTTANAQMIGGTTLFRLYDVESAVDWQVRLARHRVWTRVFPYNPRWLRLGLPGPSGWEQLAKALA